MTVTVTVDQTIQNVPYRAQTVVDFDPAVFDANDLISAGLASTNVDDTAPVITHVDARPV